MYPARLLVVGFLAVLLLVLLPSFTPAYAQETFDAVGFKTCKGEQKTWENVDSELKTAGYPGPFDHSQTEYNKYIELYNKANCPSGSTPTSGNVGVGSSAGSYTKPVIDNPNSSAGDPLSESNYNYLLHGQTSIEGSLGHTALCLEAGESLLNECIGYKAQLNKTTGMIETAKPLVFNKLPNGGALGGLAMVNSTMFDNPPTSSTFYLAKIGHQFGVVPETAYAQVTGSGEGIIAPVEKLWEVIRNTVYLFFVLIFMVVGVMVMFRKKISQNAVVTVQQALPNLVVGLILVYFSYFIAALCVDLAFFGVQLVAGLFTMAQAGGANNAIQDIPGIARSSNIFMLFAGAGTGGLGTIFTAVNGQINTTSSQLLPGVPAAGVLAPAAAGAFAGAILGFGLPGALVGGLAGAFGQYIIPILLILVVMTALLIQVFRLTFSLIMAYIQILVFTIAGPILILVGCIPGQGSRTSFWIRGLVANALIFPAVFAVILFAGMILGDRATPMTSALPLLGGFGVNGDLIKVLIAYGIIMGSPAIPDMIRKQFKVNMDATIMNEAMGAFNYSRGVITDSVVSPIGTGALRTIYRMGADAPSGSVTRRAGINVRRRFGGAAGLKGNISADAGPTASEG